MVHKFSTVQHEKNKIQIGIFFHIDPNILQISQYLAKHLSSLLQMMQHIILSVMGSVRVVLFLLSL